MSEHRTEQHTIRQWYANGFGVAIVAVTNHYDGKLFDWACYVGGAPSDVYPKGEDLRPFVAEYGCKIDRDLAHHLAPSLDIKRYRD